MSGRVYVSQQAGRTDRSRPEDAEPWGTTASQSHFRAYEPAEARSCRGAAAAPLPPARQARTPSTLGHRQLQSVPEGSVARSAAERLSLDGSAAGRSASSRRSGSSAGPSHLGQRQSPSQRYTLASAYQEDQRLAQEARQQHFPYRDEFAPRSKRLLYELAHARCSRDATGSAASGSVSCFTVASTASSGGARSLARSASEPSTCSLPRVHTADSQRVADGLARRRHELNLRAPSQWEADRAWLQQKLAEDGPAGITSANHVGPMYNKTLCKDGERIFHINAIFSGERETEPRTAGG